MTDTKFFARPIFRVANATLSIEYYCDKLGFTKIWTHEEDGETLLGQVERGDASIILDQSSNLPKPSETSVISMTLHQEERLNELFEEFTKSGAMIDKKPFKVLWDEKIYQMDILDLDKNLLTFWGHQSA